ncbi:MAG: hypothetical protein LBK76_03745 [Verrucomicrobiales bacterium]|jgi:hypothetical protein|nr:hypothetical protein [Verrucomicrobiales bacterium]
MKLTVNLTLVRGILVGLTGYNLLFLLQGLLHGLWYLLMVSGGEPLHPSLYAGQLVLIAMQVFLLFALLKKTLPFMPLIFTLFIVQAALNTILPTFYAITNPQHLEPARQLQQFALALAQTYVIVSLVAVWLAWLLYRANKPAAGGAR